MNGRMQFAPFRCSLPHATANARSGSHCRLAGQSSPIVTRENQLLGRWLTDGHLAQASSYSGRLTLQLQFPFLSTTLWTALKTMLNYKVANMIVVPVKNTLRTCPNALRSTAARAELRTISLAGPVAIQPMPTCTRRGTSVHPGWPGFSGNTKRPGLTHLHSEARRRRPLQQPVKSMLRRPHDPSSE